MVDGAFGADVGQGVDVLASQEGGGVLAGVERGVVQRRQQLTEIKVVVLAGGSNGTVGRSSGGRSSGGREERTWVVHHHPYLERDTERQRDRETEEQRHRDTEKHRDRETERQRDRETETERQRDRDRDRERETVKTHRVSHVEWGDHHHNTLAPPYSKTTGVVRVAFQRDVVKVRKRPFYLFQFLLNGLDRVLFLKPTPRRVEFADVFADKGVRN